MAGEVDHGLSIFVAEVIGTAILVLLGDGVVANVVLNKSKGQGSGWMVITTGWAFGVAVAVYAVGWISGAHINPAVTIAQATIGNLAWGQVPVYLGGQVLGGFIGAVLVWLAYLPHWPVSDDPDAKLSVFSTTPAVRNLPANFLTELIGSVMLMLGILVITDGHNGLVGGQAAFLVGVLVWAIGLSLGGPTGYAINPARDLGPRVAHAILPIPGKRDSDWGYAWVPVIAPIVGAVLGALLYAWLWH